MDFSVEMSLTWLLNSVVNMLDQRGFSYSLSVGPVRGIPSRRSCPASIYKSDDDDDDDKDLHDHAILCPRSWLRSRGR